MGPATPSRAAGIEISSTCPSESLFTGAAKAVFSGKATDDPVLMALGDAQKKFTIPPELFEKLVYGTSLDLDTPPASAEAADK